MVRMTNIDGLSRFRRIIDGLSIHRLVLACLTVAVKYHDDVYFTNTAFRGANGCERPEECPETEKAPSEGSSVGALCAWDL